MTPGACLGDENIHSLHTKEHVMSSENGSPVTVQETPQYNPPPLPPPQSQPDSYEAAKQTAAYRDWWGAANQQLQFDQGVFNNKV
jgi:hypothetical protein